MCSSEKRFHNKIVYISFILSIMVIQIHTYNLETYQLVSRNDWFAQLVRGYENYFNNLETVCVPFFFFISGVLFYRTFQWSKILEKYRSRIRSLAIPYLCWCTVYYLYFVFLTNVPIVSGYVVSDTIEFSVTEWIGWLWAKSYYTLWFLKELLLLVLLSPIIYLLLKNHGNSKLPTGIIIFVSLITITLIGDREIFGFNIYYFGGALLGINYDYLLHDKNKVLSIAGMIYVIIYLIMLPWQITNHTIEQIMKLIFVIAIWFALDFFMQFEREPYWWMRITFFVYCAHDLILEALEKLFILLFGKATVWALIDFVGMPIVVFALCAVCAALLKSYTPLVWKIISGAR